ncbi:hypothetical protein [Peptoniphilus harei]|uniref:hypothetical protein n=1 Tax=Peptoniphilus harei TaxID=54005 RepID=UPI001899B0E7|nr:hypothetical protein [Peptoniphilus harei]
MDDKLNLDSSENNLEKTFCILIGVLCFNLLFIVILFLMTLHYKILGENLVGTVLAALIGVNGVLAGFYFNKKQTYKEIVTRERIEWLHKMQENLALYLDLTSSNKEERKKLEEDYKNTVDKLYYEILFNINHVKDEKAMNALENYHMEYKNKKNKKSKEETKDDAQKNNEDKDKFEIELEKIDKNTFKIKDSKELEETFKHIIEEDELKDEVMKEFVEIFYKTWRDIKGEAF